MAYAAGTVANTWQTLHLATCQQDSLPSRGGNRRSESSGQSAVPTIPEFVRKNFEPFRAVVAGCGLLVGKDSRCDPADAFGIGDRIDLDDLSLDDGEADDGDLLPPCNDEHSGCSVHQRGS